MSTLETLKKNKAGILAIAVKYGVSNARIFGSVIRDEDSDFDVLVDMASDRSRLDLVGFQKEIEALVNHKADVLTKSGLNHDLKNHILAEATPL